MLFVSQLQQLLLRIYGNIDEPDSITAVSALCERPQQLLQVQSHSGNWSTMLAAADRAMQVAAVQGSPPHQQKGLAVEMWAHAVNALSHLGCATVAQACLSQCRQLLPQDSAAQSSIREKMFESAWRNGGWPSGNNAVGGDLLASLKVS
jgi:hypothetical protein